MVIQPLLDEVSRLRKENKALRAARDEAVAEAQHLRTVYEGLCHEYSKLRRKMLGPTKERVPSTEAQGSLLDLLGALGRVAVDEASARAALSKRDCVKPDRTRKEAAPHGRRNLAAFELPVERVVLEPPERLVRGGERLEKIGEEVSEIIERRPAMLVRVQVVRPKYKLPTSPLSRVRAEETSPPDTAIVVAPPLERPLARGMAGPGLLAHVLVSKYGDHVPLHRQQSIFQREGLVLSRSTLSGWVGGCARLLKHLVDAMWADARGTASVVLTDATGILVLDKEQCRRVSFYVVVVPGEHVLFGAVAKNDGPSVAQLLAGFGGRPVVSDASSVYHELQRQEARAGRPVIEVGCWSHARRVAFEALPTDRPRALRLIGFIGLLYETHRTVTDPRTGQTDGRKRKRLAAPIIQELYRYVDAERPRLVAGTPIAEAFGYLVNQKQPLLRFLDDGRLRLDNNPSELQLRAEVVGRKNWLFCGSDAGVEWNTTVVSLIASCRLLGIEPWAYLRDVLMLLPGWRKSRVLELAPRYWRATRSRPATKRRLAQLQFLDGPPPAALAA